VADAVVVALGFAFVSDRRGLPYLVMFVIELKTGRAPYVGAPRILVIVTGVLVGSAMLDACHGSESAWPNPCPQARMSTRECAERLAIELCDKPPERRAAQKSAVEQIPREMQHVDIIEPSGDRCGCVFRWMSGCFLVGQMDRPTYVVTTGARGCDDKQAAAFGRTSKTDPTRCGQIGTIYDR
jgi:hypothetical protein